MNEKFLKLCKKNDSGLRAALGNDKRFSILGDLGEGCDDFYLLGIDRDLLGSGESLKTDSFILIVKIKQEDVIFEAYNSFVNDMYGIGSIDVQKEGQVLGQSVSSIEKKIKKLPGEPKYHPVDSLKLDEDEEWFKTFIEKNRWTFDIKKTYSKEEFLLSTHMFKAMKQLVKEYSLRNSNISKPKR